MQIPLLQSSLIKDQSLFDELDYGSNEGKSRPEVIEALLKAGANVNAKDNGGDTPLYAALFEDDITTAEIFVKHGADVNAKIREEPLIMTIITSRGLPETNAKMMAEFLLKHNANPNAVDSDGRTALYHAAYKNKPEIINALLTAGAEVNAKDKEGSTPLMNAAYNGHVEIAELLLKKGANPNVVTDKKYNEYSALTYAVQEVHFPVVKLLIEHHAAPNIGKGAGAELYYAKQKNPAIAKEMEDYLFSHGADKKAYLASYQEAEKLDESISKTQADNKKLDEDIKKLDNINRKLDESISKTQADNKKLDEDIKKLDNINRKLDESISKTQADNKKLDEDNKKLDEDIKKLKNINRKLGNILGSIGDAAQEKK